MGGNWRERTATTFTCEKKPPHGSRGMVVGKHPVASAAGSEMLLAKLRSLGHQVVEMATVAGGMNAIEFQDDGTLSGAACWRADATPVGIAGGLARAGVGFGLR